MQALQAGSINAADLMGWSDRIGTIEAGKFADIVAVDGDRLQDITVMQHVGFVMKGGVVYKGWRLDSTQTKLELSIGPERNNELEKVDSVSINRSQGMSFFRTFFAICGVLLLTMAGWSQTSGQLSGLAQDASGGYWQA